MPLVLELEEVEIEMMAELMAERAEERSERGDFLPHRRPHPQADVHCARVIVAKQFRCPVLPHPQRSSGKHTDGARRNFVELRRPFEEF